MRTYFDISESVEYSMTYKFLTDDRYQIICSSNIRSEDDLQSPSIRFYLFDEESSTKLIKPVHEDKEDQPMMVGLHENMIGRIFITNPLDNGAIHNALHGLRTSSKIWHSKDSNDLNDIRSKLYNA